MPPEPNAGTNAARTTLIPMTKGLAQCRFNPIDSANMNSLKKPLLGLLLALSGLLMAGCVGSQQGAAIPWSRPASWENQVPGMGTAPGLGGR